MEGDPLCIFLSHQSYISIHSLRMEGDLPYMSICFVFENFNPLPPHGGRLFCGNCGHQMKHFNPLPPHGGRPLLEDTFGYDVNISIHSLRMEGDLSGRL